MRRGEAGKISYIIGWGRGEKKIFEEKN